jgi:alcohol dehydrogenase class IV
LGHAIGARHHLDNGMANAIVLPHMLRFNGTANEVGLQKVAAALGLPQSEGQPLVDAVVNQVQALLAQMGTPARLRDVGIAREGLQEIADHAIGDWFLRGNPRPVREASELHQVLEAAW